MSIYDKLPCLVQKAYSVVACVVSVLKFTRLARVTSSISLFAAMENRNGVHSLYSKIDECCSISKAIRSLGFVCKFFFLTQFPPLFSLEIWCASCIHT